MNLFQEFLPMKTMIPSEKHQMTLKTIQSLGRGGGRVLDGFGLQYGSISLTKSIL